MKSHLSETASTSARTGKIARLPREIRRQLNQRLEDGESAQVLVAWLNECEVVRKRLAEYYEGKPITEQNLSDWRQGGFLEWQRHQESRALLREFLNEAEELGEEAGGDLLADRMVNIVEAVLLRLFREAVAAESGPEQRQAVLEVARELARLRRGDHQGQRVRLLVERQRATFDEKEEAKLERKREGRLLRLARLSAQWESYLQELANKKGKLTPERAEFIRDFYCEYEDELIEAGAVPPPKSPKTSGKGLRSEAKIESNRA